MSPKFLIPGKPVSGYALATPKAYQPKPIENILKKIFKLFSSAIYVAIILLAFSQITHYAPSLLGSRHTSSAITSFKYATVDATGKQDPTLATYTVNLIASLSLNDISCKCCPILQNLHGMQPVNVI